jgi:DNA oxidative demethylase
LSRRVVHTAAQPALVELMPAGVWLFRSMAGRGEQELMREELREVARVAPFVVPEMPGGTDFNLRLTNAGAVGWSARGGRFYYSRTQTTGRRKGERWPAIPPTVLATAQRAASMAGCENFNPTACLVNYYEGGGGLGHHRDDTNVEDFNMPIVTISLGDAALFDIGGLSKTDPTKTVELNSGDVLVMWIVGRLLYHSVRRILAGTSDLLAKGGRMSATLRTVRR